MKSAPAFVIEDYFAAHHAKCRVNIGSSGSGELTVGEVLEICGRELGELQDILLTDPDPAGSLELRTAIAAQYEEADADKILVTHGSSEALYLLMASLLEPGDTALSVVPCYQSLSDLPTLFGARVEQIPISFEAGYTYPVDEICARLNAHTKVVVLNAPHNPTGAVLTAAEIEHIVSHAEKHGTWVIFDEAFSDITFHDEAPASGHRFGERCVTVGTLSKSYGLTGLRVGWCYAEASSTRTLCNLKAYTTIQMSPLIEAVATLVMNERTRFLAIQRKRARQGLDALSAWIATTPLRWIPPRGGTSCFPRLPDGLDAEQLCVRLADAHGVFLIPGGVFGQPRHIRIGFGHGVSHVQPGLEALTHELERMVERPTRAHAL